MYHSRKSSSLKKICKSSFKICCLSKHIKPNCRTENNFLALSTNNVYFKTAEDKFD